LPWVREVCLVSLAARAARQTRPGTIRRQWIVPAAGPVGVRQFAWHSWFVDQKSLPCSSGRKSARHAGPDWRAVHTWTISKQ